LKELRESQSSQSGDVQKIVESMESQGLVVKTMHDSLNRKGRRGR
jgi:DNA-binding MarR family transcriptional regulator